MLHLFGLSLGTALGIYGLWVLLNKQAAPLFFSQPAVKYRPHLILGLRLCRPGSYRNSDDLVAASTTDEAKFFNLPWFSDIFD